MIRHLAHPPRPPSDEPGRAAWVEMAREFAAAPPLTVHAAQPEVLAAVWAVLRETVLVPGAVSREIKEAIAATVSTVNACPYCVDVHGMFRRAAHHVAAAPAAELAAAVAWARACRSPEDARLAAPPFSKEQAPEMVGTAAAFTYINRIVSVLLDESPFPRGVRFLRGPLGRLAGRLLARTVGRPLVPGAAVARLPAAAVPPALAWARPRPAIAAAFAQLGVATDRAVAPVLSAPARQRVIAVLADWHGDEPPFGRAWLDEAVAGLAAEDLAVARLAVLTALAPARVTAADVAAFAADRPGDAALVALLAWSAYQTTHRAAGWLCGPYREFREMP
ncbi:MAG: carboxymuconolactone decarboxylase family protein [Thermoanaerobaculia bacterium]|nr:carboxymuconolactone decarboxylase family protein [Thermoanaerobaculia bacterium]